jgi:hypothetical protein
VQHACAGRAAGAQVRGLSSPGLSSPGPAARLRRHASPSSLAWGWPGTQSWRPSPRACRSLWAENRVCTPSRWAARREASLPRVVSIRCCHGAPPDIASVARCSCTSSLIAPSSPRAAAKPNAVWPALLRTSGFPGTPTEQASGRYNAPTSAPPPHWRQNAETVHLVEPAEPRWRGVS